MPGRGDMAAAAAAAVASHGGADMLAAAASRRGLMSIRGGSFAMGTDEPNGFREDGEGPSRLVAVSSFYLASAAVTNREFGNFVRSTQYITDAERCGSSFVFHMLVPPEIKADIRRVPAGLPWWLEIGGACWQRPEGPGSHIYGRLDHPVVHVSWNDAMAYCAWSGQRLPTEAEWEFAARGGLAGKAYPWGDLLEPEGRPACNIWQGTFPHEAAPGWRPTTMPVRSFTPNGYGLYSMSGNVWEWCADWFSPAYHRETAAADPHYRTSTGRRSMRGGSFLCHESYCNRYRVAARSSNSPSSSAGNCGFRVAA
jgi:formylglycine-generating enzyme required for sulfatase activity